MTYKLVYSIGEYTKIFSVLNNNYVIVSALENPEFWNIFCLDKLEQIHCTEEIKEQLEDNNCKVVCQFKANSVKSLREYIQKQGGILSYSRSCALLISLYIQHKKLLKNKKMIPFYSLDDIICIDNIFKYANPSKLLNVEQFKARVNVSYDLCNKNHFYAPEILNNHNHNHTLPFYITPNATLFSMGYMITVCYFGNLPNDRKMKSKKQLDKIYSSKLYWSLLRCLYTNPESRFFAII